MLHTIGQVPCLGEGQDVRRWVPSKDGSFSVAYFYLALAGRSMGESLELSLEDEGAPKSYGFWLACSSREDSYYG